MSKGLLTRVENLILVLLACTLVTVLSIYIVRNWNPKDPAERWACEVRQGQGQVILYCKPVEGGTR